MKGKTDSATSGMSNQSTRAKRNDSIMATNNSSIVSKRSVERLYRPEPHFFRYFVKKPQRRSPLINRGYWLRMYAMERVVDDFLNETSDKQKIIVNLGCGYDPLAFQLISKNTKGYRNAKFIDIDYPELVARKVDTISQTPELVDLLALWDRDVHQDADPALLRSEQYIAIGCDLADIHKLNTIVTNEVDSETCSTLFLAEVSLTYMDLTAADALLKWASLLNDSRFCLLEQILPNGPAYPFAKKMIQHFDNLKTPLQSVHRYPRSESQERRFRDAGWPSAKARSLWDLWDDSSFITSSQRVALSEVEPFDEWEEFALFASHYFLLVATNTPEVDGSCFSRATINLGLNNFDFSDRIAISKMSDISSSDFSQKFGIYRRFGASVPISANTILHHGGLGTQKRLNTTQSFKSDGKENTNLRLPPLAIEPRMCHTMTMLDRNRCLLVGGRTSPDHALSDCWLYKDKTWERVEDLPLPLYRHSATVASSDELNECVLIYGGRSSGGKVSNDWLLWHNSTGWVKLAVIGASIKPRFGASMSFTGPGNGVLLGGMMDDGTIVSELWHWSISCTNMYHSIKLSSNLKINGLEERHLAVTCRVGACLTWSSNSLILIGGVAKQFLPQNLEIILLDPKQPNSILDESTVYEASPLRYTPKDQVPLLIGHSASSFKNSVVITGGGSVCFSFGTYWNHSLTALQIGTCDKPQVWAEVKHGELIYDSEPPEKEANDSSQVSKPFLRDEKIKREVTKVNILAPGQFERLMNNSKPFLIENMSLGTCIEEWTLEYLKTKVSTERSIVVHEASGQHMDFTHKNFRYVRKPFGQFIDEIEEGAQQYLRSLAAEKPTIKPANFAFDFPELASDFQLPPQLNQVIRYMHSSPLRISGPVIMWLHYDVMANVLCQIRGSKRVILYPPSDVPYFNIAPGESSSSINVFDEDAATLYPSLMHAHPQEAILKPGDILYIPPVWLHTALPIGNHSISINVFFRNLKTGYSAGKDVYGNRDLQAYEYGRKAIEKISKAFEGVSPQIARFYLERLAGELTQKACSNTN